MGGNIWSNFRAGDRISGTRADPRTPLEPSKEVLTGPIDHSNALCIFQPRG